MAVVVVLGGVLWATGLVDRLTGGGESASGADKPYDVFEVVVTSERDGQTFEGRVEPAGRYADKGEKAIGTDVELLRLDGVVAPGASARLECYGEESKKALEDLLPRTVEVDDAVRTDRDGRFLVWAWGPDDELVQVTLLEQGAVVLRDPVPTRFRDEMQAAQQRAEDAGAGVWGACDAGDLPS